MKPPMKIFCVHHGAMASILYAFKRGLDKFLRTNVVDCLLREYLFFSVNYFCIGLAFKLGAKLFQIMFL